MEEVRSTKRASRIMHKESNVSVSVCILHINKASNHRDKVSLAMAVDYVNVAALVVAREWWCVRNWLDGQRVVAFRCFP